ncbi:MAG: hypothetical protein ABI947_00290 [Chloroflexota bacterium]
MPKEHRIITLEKASNPDSLKVWLEKVNKLVNDGWVIITSHGDKNFIRLILERARLSLEGDPSRSADSTEA